VTRLVLEWYGHSYVRIVTESGASIVIDPHDGASLNLPEHRVEADAVLVTHNHYDHNAVEMIRGSPAVHKWRRGEFTVGDVKVVGLKSFHDKVQGKLRGENTIYILDIDGFRLAHLGDIGHKPEGSLLESLRGVDLLMIPVGGVYTIDAYEAWETVEATGARLVLPIHYWVPKSTVPLDPLDKFLNIAKAGRTRVDGNNVVITRQGLEKVRRSIIVMPDPWSVAR